MNKLLPHESFRFDPQVTCQIKLKFFTPIISSTIIVCIFKIRQVGPICTIKIVSFRLYRFKCTDSKVFVFYAHFCEHVTANATNTVSLSRFKRFNFLNVVERNRTCPIFHFQHTSGPYSMPIVRFYFKGL